MAVAIFVEESTPVNATQQARFDTLHARQLRALKLQGVAGKTLDGYARSVMPISWTRRVTETRMKPHPRNASGEAR